MGNKLGQTEKFDYYTICRRCTDEECCAEPYFTFCARNEIEQIEQKVKQFPKQFRDFLIINNIIHRNKSYEYYGIKKINKHCIFLRNSRNCLIHEVKPLHCRCFPLVWSFEEKSNELNIYLDEDPCCALVSILSKNVQWIENMKKVIIKEVQKMSIMDRIAYSTLEGDENLKLIESIDLSKKEYTL